MGKWTKLFGAETTLGERRSGRNDSLTNGKVGETTRISFCVAANLGTRACNTFVEGKNGYIADFPIVVFRVKRVSTDLTGTSKIELS